MEVKKIEATLETRVSSKSKKEYQVVILKLTDNYEKPVFLEQAEIELLKLSAPRISPFNK